MRGLSSAHDRDLVTEIPLKEGVHLGSSLARYRMSEKNLWFYTSPIGILTNDIGFFPLSQSEAVLSGAFADQTNGLSIWLLY